jgi:hypothetical protein
LPLTKHKEIKISSNLDPHGSLFCCLSQHAWGYLRPGSSREHGHGFNHKISEIQQICNGMSWPLKMYFWSCQKCRYWTVNMFFYVVLSISCSWSFDL